MTASTAACPDVSVVVPIYNEEATIAELVDRVSRTLAESHVSCELVLVDDGSTDGTAALLRILAAARPSIRVLTLSRNFGQSAALCCGIFESTGRIVVTMDADLQNPPEEVPTLLRALGPGIDLVTGRRQVRHERWWRLAGSRIVHWMARTLIGTDLSDFGGQFKAYRREVVDATRTAWAPGKPFFALAVWLGFRVAEVPVRHDERRVGESRYRLGSLIRLNLDLITSFTTAPLVLLAVMSVATGVAGAAGIAWCLGSGHRGLGLGLSLVSIALAGVFFATAALGLYLARVYRTVAGAPMGYVLRPPDGRQSADLP